jgi:hypothetical protein
MAVFNITRRGVRQNATHVSEQSSVSILSLTRYFETLVAFHQTARRHASEDATFTAADVSTQIIVWCHQPVATAQGNDRCLL